MAIWAFSFDVVSILSSKSDRIGGDTGIETIKRTFVVVFLPLTHLSFNVLMKGDYWRAVGQVVAGLHQLGRS